MLKLTTTILKHLKYSFEEGCVQSVNLGFRIMQSIQAKDDL